MWAISESTNMLTTRVPTEDEREEAGRVRHSEKRCLQALIYTHIKVSKFQIVYTQEIPSSSTPPPQTLLEPRKSWKKQEKHDSVSYKVAQ